jgi:hypothetical protein
MNFIKNVSAAFSVALLLSSMAFGQQQMQNPQNAPGAKDTLAERLQAHEQNIAIFQQRINQAIPGNSATRGRYWEMSVPDSLFFLSAAGTLVAARQIWKTDAFGNKRLVVAHETDGAPIAESEYSESMAGASPVRQSLNRAATTLRSSSNGRSWATRGVTIASVFAAILVGSEAIYDQSTNAYRLRLSNRQMSELKATLAYENQQVYQAKIEIAQASGIALRIWDYNRIPNKLRLNRITIVLRFCLSKIRNRRSKLV